MWGERSPQGRAAPAGARWRARRRPSGAGGGRAPLPPRSNRRPRGGGAAVGRDRRLAGVRGWRGVDACGSGRGGPGGGRAAGRPLAGQRLLSPQVLSAGALPDLPRLPAATASSSSPASGRYKILAGPPCCRNCQGLRVSLNPLVPVNRFVDVNHSRY